MHALAGIMGPLSLDKASPAQKEFFMHNDGTPRKRGRPKINAERPKYKERNAEYLKNRFKKLEIFLILKSFRSTVNNIPRHKQKSKDKKQRDERIMRITARRFNVKQGEQFPLPAIIKMADLKVDAAVRHINNIKVIADENNISLRKAFELYITATKDYDTPKVSRKHDRLEFKDN